MEKAPHRGKYAGLAVLAFLFSAIPALSRELTPQALFKIERSKNANIVQYDAQIEVDGKLNSNKPVAVYWIRPGKEQRIRQLSFIQKRFAYGFDAKLDQESDTVTLDMVADIGRPIVVRHADEGYRAIMRIDGAASYLEKLFIHSTGGGLSTKLVYIDMFGQDLVTGEDRYERFKQYRSPARTAQFARRLPNRDAERLAKSHFRLIPATLRDLRHGQVGAGQKLNRELHAPMR